MNTYRICLVNERLNIRRVLDINADQCIDAIHKAKDQLKGLGFDKLESARCIAYDFGSV